MQNTTKKKIPKARDKAQRETWLRDPETILADIAAAMTPKRRPGDPLPVWHLDALQAGFERWRINNRTPKAERWKPAIGPKGSGICYRFMRAMERDAWYGIKALGRSVGASSSESAWTGKKLLAKGWATRAANPGWDKTPVAPQAIQAGAIREPKWLFQITEAGLIERVRFDAL